MPIDSFRSALEKALSRPLTKSNPQIENKPPDHAAVSISFFPTGANSLGFLMIRRALSPSDPWSGQMAFPGGKQEKQDPNLLATALRETQEEIGLDLKMHGQFLGQLTPLQGRRAGAPIPLFITPFVFWLDSISELSLDPEEVDSTHWVDLGHCLRQRSHVDYTFKRDNLNIPLPAISHHPVPIWGISYLMLKDIVDKVFAETNPSNLVQLFNGDFSDSWRGY